MDEPRLDHWKKLILKMVEVHKDLGFEVDVRGGLISFLDITREETRLKQELIQKLISRAEEYPKESRADLLSLLHEALYDVEFGQL